MTFEQAEGFNYSMPDSQRSISHQSLDVAASERLQAGAIKDSPVSDKILIRGYLQTA